ncbi:glycosyltransferase family 25 protein [Allorhizobium sp. BGMRC 0089]|uniref:glycosyltransferase family 25 protein n=1 Tax=Allorhizobium sonneratiae TaxID=2934936 RepID=UPI0020332CB8|nr:glycosyltransferase family 25 protein [Allorhizobium sonneratiae]MCM2291805.1 glycosyltransferase family 25 protein [Allorhizobium sonneratiae]
MRDSRTQIPIYIISLVGSPRRDACREILDRTGVNYCFFDAVNGKTLSYADICTVFDEVQNRVGFKRKLSSAEIGCYLSHQRLWQKIADGEEQAALILEDDCHILPELPHFLKSAASFDLSEVVIKLDGQSDKPRRLKPGSVVQLGPFCVGEPYKIPALTTGYIIGKKAAAAMLGARRRFYRPVDLDFKFVWEHRVPVLISDRVVVSEHRDALATSAICNSRSAVKKGDVLSRFVANMKHQSVLKFKTIMWNGSRREFNTLKKYNEA